MKMNKNKGFTLIELLAVIVILAIIALISVPLIMGIIEKTQVSAYKESLRSIFQATDIYLATNGFGDVPEEGIDVANSNFPLKNNMFLSGKIVKNAQGQLELNNVTNGHYCGSGTLDNIVVVKESCDTTAPIITVSPTTVEISLGSTYNDVGVTATDDIEGNITDRIVVTGEVNTSVIGSYTLTYNVSDSSGNAATEKTRTVNVIAALASLTTDSNVTNITSTGATISGEVTSDGGGTITERGIVYGTSPNPITSDAKLVISGTTGTFSGNLTGLENLTTYYARVYAINSEGISYGSEINFTTTTNGIDQYTVMMLHFDGTDNGTSFTDDTGKAVTRYGNTVTKVGTKKFGTASAYFDGSGDYLKITNSSDFNFGTSNFTIDFWALSSYSSARTHTFSFEPTYGTANLDFDFNDSYGIWVYWNGVGENNVRFGNVGAYTNGIWHHYAFVRSGNTFTLYVDGNSVGSTTYSSPINLSNGTNCFIGSGPGSWYWNGYIDEMRISKGIARWTANFTPPAGPYTQ